jgi:hypothetical protein
MAMVPIGEVAQEADGHGAATDLYVTNGLLAAAHAIKEVLGVAVAVIKANRVGAERFVG